jgi:hypothetical protein
MLTRTKRSIKRRNNKKLKKRLSKKLRGGVNSQNSTLSTPFALLETSNSQGPMNISELDSSQGTMNLSELNITDSSDINNTTLNTNDLSIDNHELNRQNNNFLITPVETNELDITMDTDLSTLSGNTTSEEISMTFGGRKSKKYNKVRKVKKGSKKVRKTRKTRNNKSQRGGQGFTTSETTNPIAYKEDEYDQFKNALNYKTK